MRAALIVGCAGAAAVWLGLVLALSLLVGVLPAIACGLVTVGIALALLAEYVLAPKPARWPR